MKPKGPAPCTVPTLSSPAPTPTCLAKAKAVKRARTTAWRDADSLAECSERMHGNGPFHKGPRLPESRTPDGHTVLPGKCGPIPAWRTLTWLVFDLVGVRRDVERDARQVRVSGLWLSAFEGEAEASSPFSPQQTLIKFLPLSSPALL